MKATRKENSKILAIARRNGKILRRFGEEPETTTVAFYVKAVHLNGTPLDLDGLLKANDFEFSHDVFGIMEHIDIKTGKLTGGFEPWYALE